VQRPCLTIGLTVQPEILQGLAGRPGFRGRGLLARFLYSLPASDDPTVLTLDPQAGELLLGFERDLEPRLAAGSGCTGALGLPVAIRDPRPVDVDMDGRGNT
jgi:hypothetical protein